MLLVKATFNTILSYHKSFQIHLTLSTFVSFSNIKFKLYLIGTSHITLILCLKQPKFKMEKKLKIEDL